MKTERGRLRIADISRKKSSFRTSVAEGEIVLKPATVSAIRRGSVPKGDVLTVAKVSAVLAIKKTSELIPACHMIAIEDTEIDFELRNNGVNIKCGIKAEAKTGVEMEALTGVCIGLLTIWDMVKELEKDERGQYPTTILQGVRVIRKVKT